MLRLVVVGVGWAGNRHVEAVRELGRKVEVVGLVDSDAAFLAEKAQELGVEKTYTAYEAVLDDDGVDAVSICTPHGLHAPMAVAAARAGKHVLVEKPMATTVAEAGLMLEAAQANNVRLYVAENASYDPLAKFLRQVVHSGQYIGELTCAACTKGFRAFHYGYPGRRAWLGRTDLGGTGTWMLHGIHSMAQLRHIFGEVAQVYMREHKTAAYERRELEGTMSGSLTLKEGGVQVAVVQTSETRLYGDLGGYVLHGTAGSLRATDEGCTLFDDDHQGLPLAYPQEPLSSYAQEIEAFADYVASGAEGPTTGTSERRSLAIVQAGYEAAQSGQPVDLEKRFGPL